jgi:nucleotidyltransferase AbiEii toxin of type IV toxin-antitoxin system
VAEHPALTWLRDEGRTERARSRKDVFAYESRFGALPGLRAAVLLEPGVRSGSFPTETVPIVSMVGEYLLEQGRAEAAEDLGGFEMPLLHFRRTFVEKLFALHDKLTRFQAGGPRLDRDARHYSDLYVLASEREVRAMLASPEYLEIRRDCDAKSREFFQDRL